jgi:hypothetical protein
MEQAIPVNLNEFNEFFSEKYGNYRGDWPVFRSCTIQTKDIAKLEALLPIPQNVKTKLKATGCAAAPTLNQDASATHHCADQTRYLDLSFLKPLQHVTR